MGQLDFIVMILFALFILAIGLAFSKTGSDSKSFFAAGENAPWWVSGLSLFMSFLSAGTFVVWGSIAYDFGLVAIVVQLTMCVGGIVTALFIAARWKKTGALTAAEYVGNRLGTNLQQFYTYLFLLFSVVTTAQVLYPVGKMVHLATPLSLEVSVVLLGILVIAYTAAGGLWAVMVTDVLQFVILFAAVLILLPLSLDAVGGIGSFFEQAPEGFFKPLSSEYSLGFILAFTLYHIVYISGNWAFVQRYTSVKDVKASKKVAWLFAGMYAISPIIWMLPPMIYRIMEPNLSGLESEGAYLMISRKMMPAGLMGLMLAAMISATASTANTILNLLAAVFTNDIYKKVFRPDASDKQAVRVGRLSTVFFGLITIGLALLVPKLGGLVNVVLSIGAITGGSLLAPVIWTLFSKKQTSTSIFTTTVVGLTASLLFKFLVPVVFGYTLPRALEMSLGIGLPLLVLAFFEWVIYRHVQEAVQYKAYLDLRQEKEVQQLLQPQDMSQSNDQNTFAVKAIAVGLLVTGSGITVLGFLGDVTSWPAVSIGSFILVASLGVWRGATKSIAVPNKVTA